MVFDMVKRFFGKQENAFSYLVALGKCLAMGLITGTIVGLVGSAFGNSLEFAGALRAEYPWLMYFLPLAGLLIVFLYRITKNTEDTGTNMVIEFFHSSKQISYKMAPLIFISTVLTHLCGGSAGREGAALQLGGSITNFLSDIKFLRFTKRDHRINVMCGMSAGFSALFGTPMAAAIFPMEVITVGKMQYAAMIPCVLSSFTAYFISTAFGMHPEAFTIASVPVFTAGRMVEFLLFGAALGILSVLFCLFLHKIEHLYTHFLKNPYVRIFTAGCLVVGLTLVLGTTRYLGSGIGILEQIFAENEPAHASVFLLKILFTALTLGAGFKGGEIVPSFCIGAAFGSCLASLLGVPVTLAAACGMAGVFCGVTNSPITALLIAFEMFGFDAMPYFLMTVAVSYMLSGYAGLYKTQQIVYSKT